MPIDDFGQTIGGARKDLRGTFSAEDISRLTHIERSKLVRKDMVWPTPDYVDLVENKGWSQMAAAAIKMLRDAFPACPGASSSITEESYEEACRLYVEALNAVKGVCEKAPTLEALASGLGSNTEVREKIGYVEIESPERGVIHASESFKRWVSRSAMALGVGAYRDILNALSHASQGSLNYATRVMLRSNGEWPRGTSRVETVIRKESVTIVRSPGGWMVGRYGRPIIGVDADYCRSRKRFGSVVGNVFPSEEECRNALVGAIEASFDRERLAKKTKKDALMGKSGPESAVAPGDRSGPDMRGGRPATGDQYLSDFGMRGGEFGNWVNDLERQEVLNRGYDGFCDLARVLRFDPSQMSLGGDLAIAFGSRGTGGISAAAAHYEPGRNVINLTKPYGAGCLAHEFGHALDHYLGDRADDLGLPTVSDGGVRFLSRAPVFTDEHLAKVPQESSGEAREIASIRTHMEAVWNVRSLVDRDKELQLRQNRMKRAVEAFEAYIPDAVDACRRCLDRNQVADNKRNAKLSTCEAIIRKLAAPEVFDQYHSTVPEIVSDIRKVIGARGSLSYTQKRLHSLAQDLHLSRLLVDEISAPDYKPRRVTVASEYSRACARADRELGKKKPYYALREEMFARAFEASVTDILDAEGARSPFLVSGTKSAVYPAGAERGDITKSLLPSISAYGRHLPLIKRPAPAKAATEPSAAESISALEEDLVGSSPASPHQRPVQIEMPL